MRHLLAALLLALAAPVPAAAQTLAQNNEAMFRLMQAERGLSDATMARIREIFAGSPVIGQGNPAVTRHPLTPEEAAARLGGTVESIRRGYRNARFERICGRPWEVPLYDPATQRPEDATVCMHMFEYPNVPLTYPVVWVRAREAALLCAAEGARLPDAHEWEGASAGRLTPPDYPFDRIRGMGLSAAVNTMRAWHNARYAAERNIYSIGEWRPGVCATGSAKSPSCDGGSWSRCGSNTYPTGSFPQCHSPLMVYDIDGNAAEHMNLPLSEAQMSSRGSTELGVTEMKGSWFIWDTVRAHEHWSRWRAPFWHGSRVMDRASHHNYHLGFRCVRDIR
jgi:formylglycine-generating enzyme required for sulfatase activity